MINSEYSFRITCLTHGHKKSTLTMFQYVSSLVKNIKISHTVYFDKKLRIVVNWVNVSLMSHINRWIMIIKIKHEKKLIMTLSISLTVVDFIHF